MALDDIVRRIERDALEEARAIVAHAEESAAELHASASERARARADEIVASATGEAHAVAQTKVAEARLAARDSMLAAKRQLVERVLAQATDRIVALPADRYAQLIAEWVALVATGGEAVSIGHEDHARLRVRLSGALKAAHAPVRILGTTATIDRGALVKGDRVRVEVSVRTRVESQRDELVALAAGVLFGHEHPERSPEKATTTVPDGQAG